MPAATPAGTPTLRALLRRRELRLRLVSDEADLAPETPDRPAALDRTVRWVHSSDLADPTPFLSEGLALLTTGTQFRSDDPAYDEYVARLTARGVIGLGFGTEVVRHGIPPELVAACRERGVPLFEVPYRTPFIAVARANAEAVAAQAYSRRSWALAAQRAVALAALRPDGLDATLAELSRRLNAWVGLFDAVGAVTHRHPAALDRAVAAGLADEVAAALRRGSTSGSALSVGGMPFTLLTLGHSGQLRGVLAIGDADLDQEARGVVTAVVAMAELAFHQRERLGQALGRLRAGLLAALRAGEIALVDEVAGEVWGPLPTAPVQVAVTDASTLAVRDFLDGRTGHGVFYAPTAAGLVVVMDSGDALAERLVETFGVRVGLSGPGDYGDLSRLEARAVEALRAGHDGLSRFGQVAASGVLSAVDSDAARLRAEAVLAPLRAHDADGGQLEETLRTWLRNDARYDTAAEALGVHRHTVRARVAQAGRLLDVDLSGFPARAELWAALQLAGH
jgi:purine catabolism regulator